MSRELAGQYHTPREWEAVRGIITTLYRTEGKKLDEVRSILAIKHGFVASVSQYKKHLMAWKVNKASQGTGKSGLPPPPSARHKGAAELDVSAVDAAGLPSTSSTSTYTYYDPSERRVVVALVSAPPAAGPLVWPLESPGHLKSMELMRSAINGFFMPHVDVLDMVIYPKNEGWDLGTFFQSALTMSSGMAAGAFSNAKLIERYTELQNLMDRVVPSRNPIVPTCVLQTCARFYQEGQTAVLWHMLRYISARAKRSHGPGHPLGLLVDGLLHAPEFLPQLLVASTRLTVDTASRELNPGDPHTMSAQRGLYAALVATGDIHSAFDVFTYVLGKESENEREDIEATSAWRIDALLRLAWCELSLGHLDDAEGHIDEVDKALKAMEIVDTRGIHWAIHFNYLDQTAELMRRRRDPRAREVMEKALDLAKRKCDKTNWWNVIRMERHIAMLKAEEDDQKEVAPWIFPC